MLALKEFVTPSVPRIFPRCGYDAGQFGHPSLSGLRVLSLAPLHRRVGRAKKNAMQWVLAGEPYGLERPII